MKEQGMTQLADKHAIRKNHEKTSLGRFKLGRESTLKILETLRQLP